MQGMPVKSGSKRTYRAVQSACYDGKYFICAQNKNFGSWQTSSGGGRIIWIDQETGKLESSIETTEGGHMDGVAYDSDRNMVLKPSSSKEGNLLQIDNSTKAIASVSHVKMSKYCNKLTYVSTIHQLVGLSGGKFYFLKWDESKNEYVKQPNDVKLEQYHTNCGAQGIGTDGRCIYIADSHPDNDKSDYRVWVYTLEGKLVGEHKLGSGFNGSKEVESALADKDGNLWLFCPQNIEKVINYKANSAVGSTTANTTTNNQTGGKFRVKVATWQENFEEVTSSVSEENSNNHTYTMSEITIPYQDIVSKYRMPFNYLWAMLLTSGDKPYTFDLADLVRNSKIEITVHDNYNETKTISTETIKYERTYTGKANARCIYSYTVDLRKFYRRYSTTNNNGWA